tara:strand:+ start:487 stop:891 length:405 start_codon:yes stop_codon:yes gene_type:complete
MSKSKKMSLTKMFNNASTNNLGFVNNAINFDAGEVIERMTGFKKNKDDRNKDYRTTQYENYLKTIDRLNIGRTRLPGRVSGGLGTPTASPTSRVGFVGRNVANTATTLNSVLAKYQDRFLKLAQAKYYQRTTKA